MDNDHIVKSRWGLLAASIWTGTKLHKVLELDPICLISSAIKINELTDLKEGLVQFHLLINKLTMLPQECAQKQTEILNEVLLIIASIFICFFHVSSQRQHLRHTSQYTVCTATYSTLIIL